MDEWGKYVEILYDYNWIALEHDGVIEAIQNDDPAINAVVVGEMDMIIEEEIGQYLGNSTHLKYLMMYDSCRAFRSPENRRQFYEGLAASRSLKFLEICSRSSRDVCPVDTFEQFVPLVQNNNNLESIVLDDRYTGASAKAILEACSAQKIALKFWKGDNLDEAIDTLCRKSGLQHVSFKSCTFSTRACRSIKELLFKRDCEIKSVKFSYVKFDEDASVSIISSGRVSNNSVKCLSIKHLARGDAVQLLRHFDVLEKLVIKKCCTKDEKMRMASYDTTFSSALQHMPLLKSVWLDGTPLGAKSILSLRSLTNLNDLQITYGFFENDETLHELTTCFREAGTLKVLKLFNSQYATDSARCALLTSLQSSTSLEELDPGSIKSDMEMRDLIELMVSNQRIKVLTIPFSYGISSESWGAFIGMLATHEAIQEVDIRNQNGHNNMANALVGVLWVNSRMKRVHISISSLEELQIVSDHLESAGCSLEELDISYNTHGWEELDISIERARLTQIIVRALARNTSLKNLTFIHEEMEVFEFDWGPFSSMLCDKSTIDATCRSNHTLESLVLVVEGNNCVPVEILSLLHLNENPNKHAVISRKVMRHHTFENVNFVPSSLPVALGQIGISDSGIRLSQMYGILRKVPYIIKHNQRKRKLTSS